MNSVSISIIISIVCLYMFLVMRHTSYAHDTITLIEQGQVRRYYHEGVMHYALAWLKKWHATVTFPCKKTINLELFGKKGTAYFLCEKRGDTGFGVTLWVPEGTGETRLQTTLEYDVPSGKFMVTSGSLFS